MPKKEKFYIILKSHVFLPEAEKQIMGGENPSRRCIYFASHFPRK